jgi:type I restriction-modification system DNA methylase subunit
MPLSKQQLGSLLWGIADTGLRGKVEDYKAYILSLLFFKRLSDNYEWETEKRTEQFRQQYGKEPNVSFSDTFRNASESCGFFLGAHAEVGVVGDLKGAAARAFG